MKFTKITALSIVCALGGFLLLGLGTMNAEEAGYGGDILYTKPVKAVLFSHKLHVEDLGLSCNMCHDKLFQMEALNSEQSGKLNHKSFKEGKYCGGCHDGQTAFGNSQCTRCHIGVKGYDRITKLQKGESAHAKK